MGRHSLFPVAPIGKIAGSWTPVRLMLLGAEQTDAWRRVPGCGINQARPGAPGSRHVSPAGVGMLPSPVEERRATDPSLEGRWSFAAEPVLPQAPSCSLPTPVAFQASLDGSQLWSYC